MHAQTLDCWTGAAIYHVYVRSFRDSNGDGVGDLPGVIAGLDHIASLGVDAVWLSPFFASPQKDYGYDVSDYRAVDPLFGTLADFDRLLAKAHALGLKIIVDLVFCHTSDEHAWFAESRTSRENSKADWYVWADAKPDGSPPTNWQSVFGGPAWTWDARRRQYYMHNFLKEQPQLNVRNPEVQNALLDVARFWLDRGVDGFRFDAINFAAHDSLLRDNPPSGRPMPSVTRPFDLQLHIFNQSQPEILPFLENLRALMDQKPDRFSVAEIPGEDPVAEMKAYTLPGKRLHSAYGFDFLYAPKLTPALVRQALLPWTDEDSRPSWAFSNHDAPRAVSRWAAPEQRAAAARCFMMLLFSLPGAAFLYQGEELGLPQGEVPFEHLKDPEAIANWPLTLGRDGARTPFPWNAQAPNAGFSDGAAPWLPVDPAQSALALDRQEPVPDSMLAFTRNVLKVRKAHPALRMGGAAFLESPDNVLAFIRGEGAARILCLFNLSPETAAYEPPGKWSPVLAAQGGAAQPNALPAFAGFWLEPEA